MLVGRTPDTHVKVRRLPPPPSAQGAPAGEKEVGKFRLLMPRRAGQPTRHKGPGAQGNRPGIREKTR